ncbi:MAG TPA: hypothetical protein VGJ60_07345 [Chloroflexota bacterium]|jgi:hypothetical protein
MTETTTDRLEQIETRYAVTSQGMLILPPGVREDIQWLVAELKRRRVESEPGDPTPILEMLRDRVKELQEADDPDPITQLLIRTDKWENGYFYSLASVLGRTPKGELWWIETEMSEWEAELGEAVCDGRLWDESALVVTFDWEAGSVEWDDEPDWGTLKSFEGQPQGTLTTGEDS